MSMKVFFSEYNDDAEILFKQQNSLLFSPFVDSSLKNELKNFEFRSNTNYQQNSFLKRLQLSLKHDRAISSDSFSFVKSFLRLLLTSLFISLFSKTKHKLTLFFNRHCWRSSRIPFRIWIDNRTNDKDKMHFYLTSSTVDSKNLVTTRRLDPQIVVNLFETSMQREREKVNGLLVMHDEVIWFVLQHPWERSKLWHFH